MRINPISADDAQSSAVSFEPWPSGDYDFVVADAAEDLSKAGKEQIKLTLHVYNRTGARRVVFDYLSSSDAGQWKVRHFAETMNMVRQYDAGELNPHDMLGKPGRCMLRVQAASGGFDAQNKVGDYVVPRKKATEYSPSSKQTKAGLEDDAIPF